MSSDGSLDSAFKSKSLRKGAGMETANPGKVTIDDVSHGLVNASTSLFAEETAILSKLGVARLQSFTACFFLFRRTHVA